MAAEHRGFLIGALVVLALYALLSCWPALQALVNPSQAKLLGQAPPLAGPVGPPAPAPLQGPPSATPSHNYTAPPPKPAASSPASALAAALSAAQQANAADSDKAPIEVRWQVTAHNVVLSERPGGPGVLSPSISHASLTICGGSSLQVLKQQGNWAKVRSRSLSEGWVSLRELSLLD